LGLGWSRQKVVNRICVEDNDSSPGGADLELSIRSADSHSNQREAPSKIARQRRRGGVRRGTALPGHIAWNEGIYGAGVTGSARGIIGVFAGVKTGGWNTSTFTFE